MYQKHNLLFPAGKEKQSILEAESCAHEIDDIKFQSRGYTHMKLYIYIFKDYIHFLNADLIEIAD